MKFILWALVIYLGWRWFTAQKSVAGAAPEAGREPKASQASKAEDGVEQMVQCAQCGIHLPASEAIAGPERKLFCSPEHSSQHHSS
jgi:uncharacterized protein